MTRNVRYEFRNTVSMNNGAVYGGFTAEISPALGHVHDCSISFVNCTALNDTAYGTR